MREDTKKLLGKIYAVGCMAIYAGAIAILAYKAYTFEDSKKEDTRQNKPSNIEIMLEQK